MFVETKVVGGRAEFAERNLTLPAGGATLRDLLTELVGVEVDAYERRRADDHVLRVLTPADIAGGMSAGRVTSGGRTVPAAPTPPEAAERALAAFADGLYFVFLDDVQLDDLDAPVAPRPDSRLRLVRLVALAGG
ncbi:hypothetical protein [Jiangella sp. DSM 45060]|uniref:hypothetical protein n=1 Tax=Jiangella sp. DSM 45060 TaxID=1798224 RepID=UPI00087BC766|nr:hypothetical protein [Jiangella sp. DSM 45060]SDT56554.1 hypothetical protein SAMN04515669_4802 [Jiangella sp. DSM 45060]